MPSDIILVLRSDHRELITLAEQCGRTSRGFQHPEEELRRRLGAHIAAALEVVYSAGVEATASNPELHQALSFVESELKAPSRAGLAQGAAVLVDIERALVIPALERTLIGERRRIGKVFRLNRERHLRQSSSTVRRQRSRSDLYELARRADIEDRSGMTQAQLEAAVTEWERARRVDEHANPSSGRPSAHMHTGV